ncbi:MAG TPA: hypothetical protein VID29_08130 [Solirubrobacteraceae bacterium]|jgi:hypothetical protein
MQERAAAGGREGPAGSIALRVPNPVAVAAALTIALTLALPLALALGGCASNQERSARLGALRRRELLAHPAAAQGGLTVTRQSREIQVVASAVVHDASGTAVVVTLRNRSSRTLREAPIAIAVTGAGGSALYRNDAPGLDSTLVSVPVLARGARSVWVDDQVQTAGTPTGVSARVGEPAGASVGEPASASGPVPALEVHGVHTVEEAGGSGVQGTVVNRSRVAQQKLVVFAVARRGGRVVAAGRAVLAEVPAGGSTPFQVFFIGDPRGAKLEVSAPASTL